jgi:hypothetical protein
VFRLLPQTMGLAVASETRADMHRQAAARFLVAHFNVALVAGNVITLKLTCYEFWDDYKTKKSPRRDTVAVTPLDQQKILMNGKPCIRCKL